MVAGVSGRRSGEKRFRAWQEVFAMNNDREECSALRREVVESHQRARQYGVDPSRVRLEGQACLSPGELERRRKANRGYLDVASYHMRELHRFVTGLGFIGGVIDRDGYLMAIHADGESLQELMGFDCVPGSRWTEKDVGTSAISLALHEQRPIQITAEEHFSRRGREKTCSASPVFGEDGGFLGVIALSGDADQVHPHTLGMVITAARAIEQHMTITKTSRELALRNKVMEGIIESVDSGLMAVDATGVVIKVNQRGREILNRDEPLEGASLAEILGPESDWLETPRSGLGYTDREVFVKGPGKSLHLMVTAKPVLSQEGRMEGMIFVFDEIHRIRRLIDRMAGSQARFTFEDILGTSPAIQEAKRVAMLAAAGRSNVLLMGETGTGKELFAQSIHNLSDRRGHPFVAINCGAIPRELLESELFGYIEGAFTGASKGGRPGKLELADKGTVFLDEVGDMPADMQVKLLRALQSGEVFRIGQHKPISVDIRIIAASRPGLGEKVDQGAFREDLFYRLNVLPITIPPLRDRGEDLFILARHVLRRCTQTLRKPGIRFSEEARRFLAGHSWPGNVRELENVVERAVNLVEGQVIEPRHFGHLAAVKRSEVPDSGALLQEAERRTIQETLRKTQFNVSRTALMLGISRATLYKRIKKYALDLSRRGV